MGLLSKVTGRQPSPPMSGTDGNEGSSAPRNQKEDIDDYPFLTGRVFAMGILVSMGGLIFGGSSSACLY